MSPVVIPVEVLDLVRDGLRGQISLAGNTSRAPTSNRRAKPSRTLPRPPRGRWVCCWGRSSQTPKPRGCSSSRACRCVHPSQRSAACARTPPRSARSNATAPGEAAIPPRSPAPAARRRRPRGGPSLTWPLLCGRRRAHDGGEPTPTVCRLDVADCLRAPIRESPWSAEQEKTGEAYTCQNVGEAPVRGTPKSADHGQRNVVHDTLQPVTVQFDYVPIALTAQMECCTEPTAGDLNA
jgi:hypothetical protein